MDNNYVAETKNPEQVKAEEQTKALKSSKKKEVMRAIKFTLFSISAGVIQIITFTLLDKLTSAPYWLAYLIALVISVIWNFTFNRRYTFQSASNVPKAMLLVALFYAVFTPASTWLEHYLTETLLWNGYIATVINMVLNFVLEFIYDRFVVFGKSLDTNDLAQKEKQ